MSWMKIVTIVVAIGLIVGGGVWAYRFFEAPESIDSITDKWSISGHADTTSVSFTRWDDDDPPQIPTACAKCHSLYGYLDWLGVDGSPEREVTEAARVGTVLYCNTCHNPVGHTLTTVLFPSDVEVTDLGREANCMRCHQGRTSTATVEDATAGIAPDTVSEDLGFINVHYAIAAATRMGGVTRIGYQYEDKTYVGFFEHVDDYQACIDCHDPHSTAINPAACAPCHSNVVSYGDLYAIRESTIDYDGDGDTEKGIWQEVNAFHETLYAAIQTYAAEVIGQPIVHANTFPYWFIDTNANGIADPDEVNFGNRYQSWTPRLVRATYNYQYVYMDPGAFTHNAEYVLQLMYDGMEDIATQVPVAYDSYTRP